MYFMMTVNFIYIYMVHMMSHVVINPTEEA
jgi:hypothetical protein